MPLILMLLIWCTYIGHFSAKVINLSVSFFRYERKDKKSDDQRFPFAIAVKEVPHGEEVTLLYVGNNFGLKRINLTLKSIMNLFD